MQKGCDNHMVTAPFSFLGEGLEADPADIPDKVRQVADALHYLLNPVTFNLSPKS